MNDSATIDLQKLYKEETGEDSEKEGTLESTDYYGQNNLISFFTDEYVWWLESKLIEFMKKRRTK